MSTQTHIIEREHRIARLMSEASAQGFLVDNEQIARMESKLSPIVDEYGEKIRRMGIENPNSNAQVQAAFEARGRTLTNVDKHTLGAMREHDELADALLHYREAHKGLNTTLAGLKLYSSADGRIHSDIKTLGARTGRFSSSSPNLQNLPREAGYRECLIADEGEVLISVDFSSVEPRVIAALSEDPKLVELYANGGDPYWDLARYIYGSEATKANRQAVKSVFLGRAYMGGARGISTQNGLPIEENEKGLASVDDLYPRVREFSLRVADEINKGAGWLTMPSGRRVSIPGDFSYKSGNGVVQGYARDLLVTSVFRLEDRGIYSHFRVPVHDEVIMSVPEARVDEFVNVVLECMSDEVRGVPILGEAEILGKAWRKV